MMSKEGDRVGYACKGMKDPTPFLGPFDPFVRDLSNLLTRNAPGNRKVQTEPLVLGDRFLWRTLRTRTGPESVGVCGVCGTLEKKNHG